MSNIDLVRQIMDGFKRHGHSYRGHIDYVKDRLGHDLVYLVDGSKAQELMPRKLKALNQGLDILIKGILNK